MSDPASDQPTSGYYAWSPPDGVTIRIRFDVVERMSADILLGFGAVPKRGAEVGGLLLGRTISSAPDAPQIEGIQIDDYQLVPIDYRRGPSYLLADADAQRFDEALHGARSQEGAQPVGFFRSHTREAAGVTAEDAALCNARFPEPWSVILLVKPQVMGVSTAGFVPKRGGAFPEGAPAFEFPFRRRELDPGSGETRRKRRREPEQTGPAAPAAEPVEPASIPEKTQGGTFDWLRSPLWVVLLLAMGGFLGYVGRMSQEGPEKAPVNPYRLHLSANRSESAQLTVHWDGAAPAIAEAPHGSLTIDDGPLHRIIDLDRAGLRAGVLSYRRIFNAVRFRLEVFPEGSASVSETLDWTE